MIYSVPKIVCDFDRVIYRTPDLIAQGRTQSKRLVSISPESYDEAYRAWSDRARATANIALMPVKDQKAFVSWAYGFVPFLAGKLHLNAEQALLLQQIHEECLDTPHVYEPMLELLRRVPRENLYIFTAGGAIDQEKKLRASGVYDMLPDGHIEIVPAKTKSVFGAILQKWHFDPDTKIIHINDRFKELTDLHDVHPLTESWWATWAWPGIEPDDASKHILRLDTIEECRKLLLPTYFPEEGGRMYREGRIQ